MLKPIVLGDKESVACFALAGFQCYSVDKQNALKTFRKLTQNESPLIFVTEGVYSVIEKDIESLSSESTTSVILIPDLSSDKSIALQNIKLRVKRATGSDIAI